MKYHDTMREDQGKNTQKPTIFFDLRLSLRNSKKPVGVDFINAVQIAACDDCRSGESGSHPKHGLAEKNDDRSQEAELHRLKGELLLAESPDQVAAADSHFQQALATARRQQDKAWELRATMSLARLWQRQGRRAEARAALAAVYGTYTEGFTTPDLVDAAALLEALA